MGMTSIEIKTRKKRKISMESLEQEYKDILKYTFKGNKKKFKKWLENGEKRDKKGLPILFL
jgi:hypothetical protein